MQGANLEKDRLQPDMESWAGYRDEVPLEMRLLVMLFFSDAINATRPIKHQPHHLLFLGWFGRLTRTQP